MSSKTKILMFIFFLEVVLNTKDEAMSHMCFKNTCKKTQKSNHLVCQFSVFLLFSWLHADQTHECFFMVYFQYMSPLLLSCWTAQNGSVRSPIITSKKQMLCEYPVEVQRGWEFMKAHRCATIRGTTVEPVSLDRLSPLSQPDVQCSLIDHTASFASWLDSRLGSIRLCACSWLIFEASLWACK